jgi:hypothetical protein
MKISTQLGLAAFVVVLTVRRVGSLPRRRWLMAPETSAESCSREYPGGEDPPL